MLELTNPDPGNESLSLIGKTVLRVAYTETVPQSSSPYAVYQTGLPDVHRVDRPVRLYITGDTAIEISWNTVKVYWDEEFESYGIKAKLVEAPGPAEERSWNVSAVDFWQDVVGQTITGVTVYNEKTWVESPRTKVHMDFSYPKTIAVNFSNNKTVFFSAAEYQPGHRYAVVRGINSLVVTTRPEAIAVPA